jgi:glycosyltransferase involved in cell wall biosynthesis
MESLAAGTPVIAFRSGALPEVVEHGRTGYLVANADEMAAAIESVDRIDPEECRRVACRYFSQEVMVSRYIDMYNRLIFRRSYDSSQTSQIECNHAV